MAMISFAVFSRDRSNPAIIITFILKGISRVRVASERGWGGGGDSLGGYAIEVNWCPRIMDHALELEKADEDVQDEPPSRVPLRITELKTSRRNSLVCLVCASFHRITFDSFR